MEIYGIKNCDTIKKALKWLDGAGKTYTFHDFKKEGVDGNRLAAWEKQVGWETLLNRRGTTWRKLPDDVRDNIGRDSAMAVMMDNPSIIKRPVVELGDQVHVGFNADEWARIIG
ncbi:ArsC family reductase [Marinobacter halodurans]|uniref:ArsC family reductase n=1 Tax=Marinobacter halodurans TaxID=2528979 RepID=A0ABY1ZLW6_9GAMM|nr:ArsC family reductase [Marinobacter halodurans]TBW56687.1 ArsC family reductase [Marinobacter halodurans]